MAPFFHNNSIPSKQDLLGLRSSRMLPKSITPALSQVPTTNPPMIPSIPSIALLAILSFSIAEILSYCGLFQDEYGLEAKEKADQFREDVFDCDREVSIANLEYYARNWWEKNRKGPDGILCLSAWKKKCRFMFDLYTFGGIKSTLRYLSFKHQFAIGCTIGMISQRLTFATIRVGVFVFFASEIMYNVKTIPHESEEAFYDDVSNPRPSNVFENIISLCCDCLDRIRFTVKKSVDAVVEMFDGSDDSIGTLIGGILFGLLLKSI